MKSLNNATSAAGLSAASFGAEQSKAGQIVQDFEALMLRQMFQQIRKFSWSPSSDNGSDYRSMADEVMAGQLAAKDALGLQKTLLPVLLQQLKWGAQAKQVN